MYNEGYGVSQDYSEAVKWYRKAAEQGNAHAQNNLGEMYEKGYGVSQDYSEAVKWYLKAAEQGNNEAQYNLHKMGERDYPLLKLERKQEMQTKNKKSSPRKSAKFSKAKI
ncbi:tetratricopeptide repeat protein [Porphyromonas gulae]|uniref:tetratricopeptide repeat protein n=1 Tax=Porphyromonas gulae TaxID=111105 RepID=UPI00068D1AFC|nr:tetratricopeptide repeat protein [Porphyromonas gulae]